MSDLEALIRARRRLEQPDLDAIMTTYAGDIVFQNHTAGEAPVVVPTRSGRTWRASSSAGPTCASRAGGSTSPTTVCVSEWTASATTPDGRRMEWDGVDVFPIRDGLIARKDVYSTSHISARF